MIRGDSDVGGPLAQQLQGRAEHPDNPVVGADVGMAGGLAVVLAKQLVRAVDEMDLHSP